MKLIEDKDHKEAQSSFIENFICELMLFSETRAAYLLKSTLRVLLSKRL